MTGQPFPAPDRIKRLFKRVEGTESSISSIETNITTIEAEIDTITGDLINPLMYNVLDYGAEGDGVTDDTDAIQTLIDLVELNGGGIVYFPAGTYILSQSTVGETYDNLGTPYDSTEIAIVLRAGVSLVGAGKGLTTLYVDNVDLDIIAMIAPENCAIIGMTLQGNWSPGEVAVAGHGIITLGDPSGVCSCLNNLWRDLEIKNVPSYGLGLQNGFPQNCRIESVTIDTSGADGMDLKARGLGGVLEPYGNHISNCTIINHGRRTDASAGIDVRGTWHLSNVVVIDFGNDAALSFVGIRFRTKTADADYWTAVGANSSLTGFFVEAQTGAASTNIVGVSSGSDRVHINNGVIKSCTNGVVITGNAVGLAERNVIEGVAVQNSANYGFEVGNINNINTLFTNCHSSGAVTAGFRNAGTDTTYISCVADEATKISTAAGSAPSEVRLGCKFAADGNMSIDSPAAGRMRMSAKGTSADIDFELNPKGAGMVRFGTRTANADAAITGYLSVKDSGGTVRKLAIIA